MRLFHRVGFFVVFLLIAVTPVLAQEGEKSPADTPTGWAFRWLNFAIVFGAIGYLAVKYGGPAFRATTEETAKKIEEGARAREEAEKQKKEIEAKLANLPKEIEAMKADAKRDTAAEAQRLRDQAKEEAQKIEKSALAEIAAAERAARLEVKALVARMAVGKARCCRDGS
jgi:F0F1-type ATP synthase membrane subunit b/b'